MDQLLITKQLSQIFLIGLYFGISGPCLILCLPLFLLYYAGADETLKNKITKTVLFCIGRVIAYSILGFFAGSTAVVLKTFLASKHFDYFKTFIGIIVSLIGFSILFMKNEKCGINCVNIKVDNLLTFFILGLMIGISPCPPLVALLLELLFISKTSYEGALYGLFFGLGTVLSNVILLIFCANLINNFSRKYNKIRYIMTKISALFIIALGMFLLID